jgi:hypothetical protein
MASFSLRPPSRAQASAISGATDHRANFLAAAGAILKTADSVTIRQEQILEIARSAWQGRKESANVAA